MKTEDYYDDTIVKNWEKEQDERHVLELKEHCIKGCTKEKLLNEEAQAFYDNFVKDKIIYHYPEDSDTMSTIIDTYNYLNKWK